jgi:hypothetical protein
MKDMCENPHDEEKAFGFKKIPHFGTLKQKKNDCS